MTTSALTTFNSFSFGFSYVSLSLRWFFSCSEVSLMFSLCLSEVLSLPYLLSVGVLYVSRLSSWDSEWLSLDSYDSSTFFLFSLLYLSIMALNSSCCLICFSSSSFLYKALSLRYSSSPPLAQASAKRFSSSKTGLSSMYLSEGILVMRVLR